MAVVHGRVVALSVDTEIRRVERPGRLRWGLAALGPIFVQPPGLAPAASPYWRVGTPDGKANRAGILVPWLTL
jgi:hypothetical protein